MTVDRASSVAALKSDPVFLHVKAGMKVILTDTDGASAQLIMDWVDTGLMCQIFIKNRNKNNLLLVYPIPSKSFFLSLVFALHRKSYFPSGV